MAIRASERGQALVLVVFGLIVLIGLTALAIDGGNAYASRQGAQNAADSGALAAALAHSRSGSESAAAAAAAAANGYNNDGSSNSVSVSVADTPAGECPHNEPGMDITVDITAHTRTYFAPIVGVSELTNAVSATARACNPYVAPPFEGNAIVALAPNGTGFSAGGTPAWDITGGGIFSNSTSSSAEECHGDAGVSAPSATTVGGTSFTCADVDVDVITTGVPQLAPADYMSLFPRPPACDGTATNIGGVWYAQAGADGSRVAFNGDMQFTEGLYCVTNSPGPFHGAITGAYVTFFIMPENFSLKFNGGGNLTAVAPYTGEYAGVLLFSEPRFVGGALQQTQDIDMRGNGNLDVVGSVIMPSANITMYGNSGSRGFNTAIIGYRVESGGNADIAVHYQAGSNYQVARPSMLYLIR